MNKKAQIATPLLAIVALVLCGSALYAMASFSNDFQSRSNELSLLIEKIETLNTYVKQQAIEFGQLLVTECKECEPIEIYFLGRQFDAQHVARTQDDGNFFAKLRNEEFTILLQEDNLYRLEIKDVYIQTHSNYNKIERTFDLCLLFNNESEYLRDCDPSELPN